MKTLQSDKAELAHADLQNEPTAASSLVWGSKKREQKKVSQRKSQIRYCPIQVSLYFTTDVQDFNDTWENQEFPPVFCSLISIPTGQAGQFDEATCMCRCFLETKFFTS